MTLLSFCVKICLSFLKEVDFLQFLIQKLMTVPILIISLTLHEISHGFAAFLMGDKTAKYNGRLSFNPLKHIDWFGFLMLLIAGIGWAKPVPVDMFRFKDPKKGMAITALAGPLMNVILVFVSLILYALGVVYEWNSYLKMFLFISAQYNAIIAMFNLLPIPPLDGSKILLSFLPDRYYYKVLAYEHYGMILIIILSFTNMTSKLISTGVDNLVNKLWNLVIKLLMLVGVA